MFHQFSDIQALPEATAGHGMIALDANRVWLANNIGGGTVTKVYEGNEWKDSVELPSTSMRVTNILQINENSFMPYSHNVWSEYLLAWDGNGGSALSEFDTTGIDRASTTEQFQAGMYTSESQEGVRVLCVMNMTNNLTHHISCK